MITGAVSPYREAIISLRVVGPTGGQFDTDAIIDTGFSDYLTLPISVIQTLALPLGGSMRVTLADASEVNMDLYLADVIWDGQRLTVSVLAADGTPLVGMSLLYGFELNVRVVDGGAVTIAALP